MTKEDDKRHRYALMLGAHRNEWIKFGRKQFGLQHDKDRARVRGIFAATSSPQEAAKRISSYFRGPARTGWKDAFKTVWVETGKASISYMHAFLTGKSFNELGQYKDDEGAAPALDTWDSHVAERIESDAFKNKILNVTDTTQQQIRSVIADGIDSGDGHYKIGEAVEEKLTTTWPGRAETISRTEANSAMNRSTLMDALFSAPDLYKKWASSGLENVRDSHQVADEDDAIPQDEQFLVGDDYMDCPGDETASAGEVVNCACCLLFVPHGKED